VDVPSNDAYPFIAEGFLGGDLQANIDAQRAIAALCRRLSMDIVGAKPRRVDEKKCSPFTPNRE
jgi:hypothetical protein